MRRSAVAGLVGVLAAGCLTAASPANAEYRAFGDYPRFANEGAYPKKSCGFRERQRRTAVWQGRTILLRYYTSRCGAYARIDGAPQGCSAMVARRSSPRSRISFVEETVDPGINFAYTKVARNINGLQTRAGLVCNDDVIVMTDWDGVWAV